MSDLSAKSQAIKEYVIKMLAYLKKENIQTLKKENNQGYFEKTTAKFSQLKDILPSLFNMIIDLEDPDEFDMNYLEEMLYVYDRVQGGRTSVEQASVQVGQQCFDKFVKPEIDMSKETQHK